MKIEKRNDKRYPCQVFLASGRKILIPQQTQFGSFCKKHGCSMAASSIALQAAGERQSDGSVWNPKEIYKKAKKAISGFNGSKLTIWGCKSIINEVAGKEVAFWHSNDGKHNAGIRANIDKQLKAGHIILFEEKNPIHTIVILGIDKKDRYIVATNGKIVRRSKTGEIRKALHGLKGARNQKNWWNGRDHGAGYVVIKG